MACAKVREYYELTQEPQDCDNLIQDIGTIFFDSPQVFNQQAYYGIGNG